MLTSPLQPRGRRRALGDHVADHEKQHGGAFAGRGVQRAAARAAALNFRLLAMLDPSAATSEPSAKRVKFEVNDVENEEGEEDEEDVLPRGHLHYRFGRGRTLG